MNMPTTNIMECQDIPDESWKRRAREVLTSDSKKLESFSRAAAALTTDKFQLRRELFNPIYISNICVNDCAYCGYRSSNKQLARNQLNSHFITQELEVLVARGVRQVLLLAGEFSREAYVPMVERAVSAVKSDGRMTWIGLEIAPLLTGDYRTLLAAGSDAIVCFQETYNRRLYRAIHQGVGPKADFAHRRSTLLRAIKGGFTEVGLGVLLGLNSDWVADVISMLGHAVELRKKAPRARLRFSFPRLRPAQGAHRAKESTISTRALEKAIIATRLTFPESTLVLTGRESTATLLHCLRYVNVVGKDGSTSVGGYTRHQTRPTDQQFELDRDLQFYEFRDRVTRAGFVLN